MDVPLFIGNFCELKGRQTRSAKHKLVSGETWREIVLETVPSYRDLLLEAPELHSEQAFLVKKLSH